MALTYLKNGSLEPGLHQLSFEELTKEYGYTMHRIQLLYGLKLAVNDLKVCGCSKIFIDGSFVTRKYTPNDYDACWSERGVDIGLLQRQSPLFFDFDNHRANQKGYYKGEWFPADTPAQINPIVIYLNFFQRDRENDAKGIITISI